MPAQPGEKDMKSLLATAAIAATMLVAMPATAQKSAYDPGPLWQVDAIKLQDGHAEEYLDFLRHQWQDNQAFAKQQGWLLDYYILANETPRDGEPDIYLVTRFTDYPTTVEIKRRDAIMQQHMQADAHALDRQSGMRSSMRTLKGSMVLRELVPAH
jgi:hypothetical protein